MRFAATLVLQLLCLMIFAQNNNDRKIFLRDYGYAPEKEIIEKRDLHSKTFKNEDGSFTSVVSLHPVHYNENGSYKDIDLHLYDAGGAGIFPYRYSNVKNQLKSFFSQSSTNGLLSLSNGYAVNEFLNLECHWEKRGQSISATKATDVSASIHRHELTYSELYPSIDAVFTMHPAKRTLNYVLKDRTALTNAPHGADYLVFSEDIIIQQNWSVEHLNNEIIVKTENGELVTRYTAPMVTEGFGVSGKETINTDVVQYELRRNGDTLTLFTKVSADWLLDMNRVFPLAIDPTADLNPDNQQGWSGTLGYNYNTTPYTVSKVNVNGIYGWMTARTSSATVDRCGWAKFPLNSFVGAAMTITQQSCRFTFDLGYSPSVGSPSVPYYLAFPMIDVDPVVESAEVMDSAIRILNITSGSTYPLYQCNTYAPYCSGGQTLFMSGGTWGLQERIDQGKTFATVALWPIVNGYNNGVTFYGYAATTYSVCPRLSFTYTLGDITVGGNVKTEICAGSKVSVPFSTSGYNYPPGTVFTVQLSHSSGSFSSATAIGTGTGPGPIIATIPPNTVPGTAYKIRVVSTSPVTYGTEMSGITITLPGAASTTFIADTICLGSTYVFNGNSLDSAGTYTDTFPSMNACDSIVILNLTVLQPAFSHIDETICAGETFQGYDSTGIYIDTLVGANGCDSIRTIQLTTLQPQLTAFSQSICDGQSYAGYTAPGVYVDTFSGVTGCDSIRTLTLAAIPNGADSVSRTVCFGEAVEQYTISGVYIDTFTSSAGCDSVRTLFLTVYPESRNDLDTSICAGASYMGYSQAGIYPDTFVNATGCDSIFYLHLSVNDLPVPVITQNNDSLFTGSFQSYQWLINGDEVEGATQSIISDLQNGDYSVVVSDVEGCTDTSAVWNITGVSIAHTNEPLVHVYPNPNNGTFIIAANRNEFLEIGLYDVHGKLLYAEHIRESIKKVDTDLPNGIYVLKMATTLAVSYSKVVVER